MSANITDANNGGTCCFDGVGDYLSIPDNEDFRFSEDSFESYLLRGKRLVLRYENIKREFYSLKRLDYSDYYVIERN